LRERPSGWCIATQTGGTELMAVDVVRAVLRRSAQDPQFRERLEREPEQVLARYALEEDEREALLTNNHALLWLWGIPDELFRGSATGREHALGTRSA